MQLSSSTATRKCPRSPLPGLSKESMKAPEHYLTGPFLLDPFYRAAAYDEHFGVFRLADLAPASFRMSEYYKNWYRTCGYEDECGLFDKAVQRQLPQHFDWPHG